MKKIISILAAVAILMSLCVISVSAAEIHDSADYQDGTHCCQDVGTVKDGVLTYSGWAGFTQTMKSFGYVIDDGEYQAKGTITTLPADDAVLLPANAGANGARIAVTVDLTQSPAGDYEVKLVAELADGTLVYVGRETPFTYVISIKDASKPSIKLDNSSAKFVDGQLFAIGADSRDITVTLENETNASGKDWIGIYSKEAIDAEGATSQNGMGYWDYVSNLGTSFKIDLAALKSNPQAFEDGKVYYVCLLENDGYTIVDKAAFTVYLEGEAHINFDEFSLTREGTSLGEITENAELKLVGWATTDKNYESLVAIINGVENQFGSGRRADAEGATKQVYSISISDTLTIPGDVENGKIEFAFKLSDGSYESLATYTYNETSEPEPQPQTADAGLVIFAIAAAAIALVVLKKKAF